MGAYSDFVLRTNLTGEEHVLNLPRWERKLSAALSASLRTTTTHKGPLHRQQRTMAEGTLEQGVRRMDVAAGDGAQIFANAAGWRVDQMNIIVKTMAREGMSHFLLLKVKECNPP